jgi:hypothetical protein
MHKMYRGKILEIKIRAIWPSHMNRKQQTDQKSFINGSGDIT